ncbi:MAG: cytochrome-c peroxidase [Steroidobacteraceae bacterium]
MSYQATLGMRLFFDSHLSGNGKVSCATCHMPARGFTDGRPLAVGINGQHGTRNTPTLWNSAYLNSFFWDGRSRSLAGQAHNPLFDSREQGLRNPQQLLDTLRHDPIYRGAFQRAFGAGASAISVSNVAYALAAYESTLIAGDSPFDRYFYGHDPRAMSAAAIRGLAIFRGRAGCATCHTITTKYALLTDNRFHDEGVGMDQIAAFLAATSVRVVRTPPALLDDLVTSDPRVAALGRFVITKNPRDIGRFRTPTLRNVALTAPYMHDGSVPTLDQAVDFEIYYRGLRSKRPLILTPNERSDLVTFLDSLTSPAAMELVTPPRPQIASQRDAAPKPGGEAALTAAGHRNGISIKSERAKYLSRPR